MKKSDFRKYIAYVKEQRHSSIEDYYIEKDYFLSMFLSTWQQLRNEGKLYHLDALIFKGGTLLVRNFLGYPRISEDLDFTHEESTVLRTLKSEEKRETEIKKRVIPIIEDLKALCDHASFDFHTDRTNTRYVEVRNSRAVYVFHMFYHSLITGEEIPIKIEINFLEKIIHRCPVFKINTIVTADVYLKSIGYDLENRTMKTYPLEEMVLEKYRALLTRDVLKERDVLDLFLIHARCMDVFECDTTLIVDKIACGTLISPVSAKNLKRNCQSLATEGFSHSDDDISRFTFVDINDEEYARFKDRLYTRLKEICTRCG
jgi:predicted nucleotidyltransferase component of viral defense system